MRTEFTAVERARIAIAPGWTEICFDDILAKLVGYPPGKNAENSGCYVKELPHLTVEQEALVYWSEQISNLEKQLAAERAHSKNLRFTLRGLSACNCGRSPHSTLCPTVRAGAALATKPDHVEPKKAKCTCRHAESQHGEDGKCRAEKEHDMGGPLYCDCVQFAEAEK